MRTEPEAPRDQWENVGDNARLMTTSDGFRCNVTRTGATWCARVTNTETHTYRKSKLSYPDDSSAMAAAIRVVEDMREKRKATAAAQRSLKL